jgi:hypothetical protein
MRYLIPALAAVALVAGCKGKAPEPVATEVAVVATETAAPMPAVATNARGTVKFAGTYTQTGADGKATSLALTADDKYTWTGADGKAVSGAFSWYKDGSTILLDAAGGKATYAIADGAVYKIVNKDAPRTGFTADQMWARAAQ